MQNDNVKFKNEFKRRLYNFVLSVIKLCRQLPQEITTKIILDQLLRSITSILANYVESQAASSRRDFTNFFNHALKSANESKVWLAILRDSELVTETKIDPLLAELTEIANILASSILTLKGKKKS